MPTLEEEISRRRTFAIISHPDAGKTTLTEKLKHVKTSLKCMMWMDSVLIQWEFLILT